MTDTAMLALDRLSGGYGSGLVVRAVTASVRAGEALCVLGRNGVGKSTLAKLACGFLRPSDGTVTMAGRDITALSPSHRARLGLAYCPQERVVFDDLTVAENLTLMRPTRDLAAFEPYFAVFPRLAERRRQHAGTLSGGEKKLLSFVRGLAADTPLVVIDEPTEGVQYENVIRMADLIAERKQRGTAFLVIEQNLTLVERVADHIAVMDHGEVVRAGAAATLARDDILAHLTV
ncbi:MULTISPECIES: ATP-binding cassette domain-containing protein [unclassified Bradyrhizobium]|uniref:ABC transporter ATP-binding protein n=1 Tax=unclassified Bradyrhizobium TaxID=2631580 RepID=UPI002012B4B4|nr:MULTISPECIES: ATP-binding cassette domain-containing protein [unclassified Bradyrhizobium]